MLAATEDNKRQKKYDYSATSKSGVSIHVRSFMVFVVVRKDDFSVEFLPKNQHRLSVETQTSWHFNS